MSYFFYEFFFRPVPRTPSWRLLLETTHLFAQPDGSPAYGMKAVLIWGQLQSFKDCKGYGPEECSWVTQVCIFINEKSFINDHQISSSGAVQQVQQLKIRFKQLHDFRTIYNRQYFLSANKNLYFTQMIIFYESWRKKSIIFSKLLYCLNWLLHKSCPLLTTQHWYIAIYILHNIQA